MKQCETVRFMLSTLGRARGLRFSDSAYPDDPAQAHRHARLDRRAGLVAAGPVGARALPHELSEAVAGRPQGRAPAPGADLGAGQVAAPEQPPGSLDPAGHQVAVASLAVAA